MKSSLLQVGLQIIFSYSNHERLQGSVAYKIVQLYNNECPLLQKCKFGKKLFAPWISLQNIFFCKSYVFTMK